MVVLFALQSAEVSLQVVFHVTRTPDSNDRRITPSGPTTGGPSGLPSNYHDVYRDVKLVGSPAEAINRFQRRVTPSTEVSHAVTRDTAIRERGLDFASVG
eukprot:COSAG01_NODE_2111_length_8407_cov_2.098700_1_plen_100_part_00